MKAIFIVRHGEYLADEERGYPLNHHGGEQMMAVGKYLQTFKDFQKWAVLTSSTLRVSQSAGVIGVYIGTKPEEHKVLCSERRMDHGAVCELIEAQGDVDAVVLVTHLEYTKYLPRYIDYKLWNGKNNFPEHEVPKGGVWHIDCEKRTCKYVQPDEL